MTNPSQEAREAAANFRDSVGIPSADLRRGEADDAVIVKAFATFEAQIRASLAPPVGEELRRRIEDLISAAMNSAITEEWEVTRHTADSIIALLPGGEPSVGGIPFGAWLKFQWEVERNAPSGLTAAQKLHDVLERYQQATPTVSPEQVEGDAVERVARAIYEKMALLFGDRIDLETPYPDLSEEARAQGAEIANAAIAAMPSPTAQAFYDAVKRYSPEGQLVAVRIAPEGLGWDVYDPAGPNAPTITETPLPSELIALTEAGEKLRAALSKDTTQ